MILDGTQQEPELIANNRVKFRKNSTWPSSLSWLRKQIEEIVNEHGPTLACIKCIEPVARKKSSERLNIEGVITEVLSSSFSIECNTRIKSQLKRDIRDFTEPARYLGHVLEDCDELPALTSPNFQDAALAAISELEPE